MALDSVGTRMLAAVLTVCLVGAGFAPASAADHSDERDQFVEDFCGPLCDTYTSICEFGVPNTDQASADDTAENTTCNEEPVRLVLWSAGTAIFAPHHAGDLLVFAVNQANDVIDFARNETRETVGEVVGLAESECEGSVCPALRDVCHSTTRMLDPSGTDGDDSSRSPVSDAVEENTPLRVGSNWHVVEVSDDVAEAGCLVFHTS